MNANQFHLVDAQGLFDVALPGGTIENDLQARLGQGDLARVEIRLAQFAIDEIEKTKILGRLVPRLLERLLGLRQIAKQILAVAALPQNEQLQFLIFLPLGLRLHLIEQLHAPRPTCPSGRT